MIEYADLRGERSAEIASQAGWPLGAWTALLGMRPRQHQYTVLTSEVIKALHDVDVAVWSWSTTDEASLVLSIELGADAVMGDDVRLMLEVLNRMRPV